MSSTVRRTPREHDAILVVDTTPKKGTQFRILSSTGSTEPVELTTQALASVVQENSYKSLFVRIEGTNPLKRNSALKQVQEVLDSK